MTVRTEIRLTRDDVEKAVCRGGYAACTDQEALDRSVLGRDILEMFAVIVERHAGVVVIVGGQHHYTNPPFVTTLLRVPWFGMRVKGCGLRFTLLYSSTSKDGGSGEDGFCEGWEGSKRRAEGGATTNNGRLTTDN